jgi:dephospho-CoA kinase
MGDIVFKSDYNVRLLRSIISPEIKRYMLEIFKEVEANHSDKYDMIAVEGAVLIEANTYPFFNELWVTTLPKEEAINRIVVRNPNISKELARDRVER